MNLKINLLLIIVTRGMIDPDFLEAQMENNKNGSLIKNTFLKKGNTLYSSNKKMLLHSLL